MYNTNVIIITETINRLITLMQAQQNIYTNAAGGLPGICAAAKIDAYTDAINILQASLVEAYGS